MLMMIGILIAAPGIIYAGMLGLGENVITIFDQVTLETKGGKEIIYYTSKGEGEKDVSSVEKARRSS
tara:strand:- start:176 stop:376 length:201 start_codon:yes stop_codon:yes gene_type:complete